MSTLYLINLTSSALRKFLQMSKQEYNPPTGQPPSWSQATGGGNSGYIPQAQPSYGHQDQQRGYGGYPQQGYPQQHQGGYYQQQGYPPQQQQGYYQQQQPMYVQQQRQGGGSEGCLLGCLAAMCMCCALDAIF